MSDERELERESEALRSAYRKLPRVEPPAALDRAVLAKARAALAAQPEVRRRPRWLLPVGIAATAVLAIGVASRLGRDQADERWRAGAPVPSAQQKAPEDRAARERAAPADHAAPAAQAPAPAAPAASPAGKTSSVDGLEAPGADAAKKLKADQAAAEPAAEEDLGKLRAAEGERTDRLQDEDKRATNEVEQRYAAPKVERKLEKQAPVVAPLPATEPMDAPAPAPPPAKPAHAPASPPPAAYAAPPPATVAAPKPFPGRDDAKSAKEQVQSETGAVPPALAEPVPQQRAKDAEAPAGGPQPERQAGKMLAAPSESRARREAQPDSSGAAATGQAAPVTNAPAAAKAEGGASSLGNTAPADVRRNASGSVVMPEEREQPQSWLAAIRRVLGGGNEAEARRELQRFVQRYPDYAVPDDLARLRE